MNGPPSAALSAVGTTGESRLPGDSRRDAQRLELGKGGSHPYPCTGSLPLKRSCLQLHRQVKRKERRTRGSFHLVSHFADVKATKVVHILQQLLYKA